ncbi:MAG: hypothetical protein AB1593_07655 [Pseudomonadota bacterium]
MNTQANVVIHIPPVQDPVDLAFLHNMLVQIEGVTGLPFSARANLVRVNYDPQLTRGQDILDKVRRFGLEARLIGM